MIIVAVLASWSGFVGVVGAAPMNAGQAEPRSGLRAGECVMAIDGRDVRDFADADNALRLRVDDVVRIDALSLEPTSETQVFVDMPIGPSIPVRTLRHEPSQQFTESLRMADISDIGVGWYHVEVRSGPCRAAFWVRVYGRSPFTTVVGLGASVLLVGGVGMLVGAVLRARRRRASMWWGAVAGMLIGVALCVLAQQFAVVAFTVAAVTAFLGGGAVAGAGATAAGSATAGTSSAGIPSPPSPSPPSPSPPSPSPPSPGSVPTHAEPSGGLPSPPTTETSEPLSPPSPEPPSVETDPPRRAFARIECPAAVVTRTPLDVIVGLSPTPVSGVAGPALVRPPSSVGDYELTAQIVADGFDVMPGETWRKTMMVTAGTPYPYVVFHLVAPAAGDPEHPLAINVLYSVDSQTMGLGVRNVRVVSSADELAEPTPLPGTVGVLGVPTTEQPPDLTVRILRGNETGRLLWSFESPHVTLDQTGESSIGDEPDVFARTVITTIAAHEGRPTLGLGLQGIGQTISAHVPSEMWEAVEAVASAVTPQRPTLLLLSDEAYVPWELAVMPTPLDALASELPRCASRHRSLGAGCETAGASTTTPRARR